MGVILGLVLENQNTDLTKKISQKLLQFSVMGLGAGMNLLVVARVGVSGFGYTVLGIAFTILLGFLVGRVLKISDGLVTLISSGTAICGGSAIAAVAPAIRAKSHEVTVSLAIIFLLNAAALFIFPFIGHLLHLNQNEFGLWSALAIHDTSSVVGASMIFGKEALEIATTVKLARALWIVPVTFLMAFIFSKKQTDAPKSKIKVPWFIGGFLLVAAIVTFVPQLKEAGEVVAQLSKKSLTLTLFLIGSQISRKSIKEVGARPFIMGVLLWVVVSTSSLFLIKMGLIRL